MYRILFLIVKSAVTLNAARDPPPSRFDYSFASFHLLMLRNASSISGISFLFLKGITVFRAFASTHLQPVCVSVRKCLNNISCTSLPRPLMVSARIIPSRITGSCGKSRCRKRVGIAFGYEAVELTKSNTELMLNPSALISATSSFSSRRLASATSARCCSRSFMFVRYNAEFTRREAVGVERVVNGQTVAAYPQAAANYSLFLVLTHNSIVSEKRLLMTYYIY